MEPRVPWRVGTGTSWPGPGKRMFYSCCIHRGMADREVLYLLPTWKSLSHRKGLSKIDQKQDETGLLSREQQRWYGYGSIPINTIFRGMNIHLPAILMFTRGTRFWHTAIYGNIKVMFRTTNQHLSRPSLYGVTNGAHLRSLPGSPTSGSLWPGSWKGGSDHLVNR